MNETERTILEQFGYWRDALTLDLGAAGFEARPLTVVIGCGSSYYLAQTVAGSLNAHGRPAIAVPGGEWLARRDDFVPGDHRVQILALSRSGETSETLAAARASLERGERVVGLTCALGSGLTRATSHCFFVPTHPLEDIVMTASASLMLLVGLRLSGAAVTLHTVEAAQRTLERHRDDLDALLDGRSHFVYLGGGSLHGVASEGALKLMEMSLSYAQAYHPLEYRHGPVSLVDERTLAVVLYRDLPEESKLALELQAKGARVLGIGGPGDLSVEVHDADPAVRGLVALPLLQWLGERVAQAKGLDTRSPRHLTKVVVLG